MKFDTNKELANYMGLDESTITKLLNGARGARGIDLCIRIERMTGIPVEAWSDEPDTLVMAGAPQRRKAK